MTRLDPKTLTVPPQDAQGLGAVLRTARKTRGWTLEEAGRRAGVARSTLSKIENGRMTPSFEIVRRLSAALEIRTPQLFVQSGGGGASGRRDVSRAGEGERLSTPTYDHRLLCPDLTRKAMTPYVSRIKARRPEEFGGWIRHAGEEFLYVLSGAVELHTEQYRPVRLEAGDSAYYDSGMGHFCLSVSAEDAEILWVSMMA